MKKRSDIHRHTNEMNLKSVFTQHENGLKDVEEKFNQISDDFGFTHETTGSIRLRNELRKKTGDLLTYKQNILEVGVGNGLMFENLNKRKINYVGLDLSIKMLKNAKKRAREYSVLFNAVRGNAVALPFKNDSFDNTICIDMLHHVPIELTTKAVDELIRITNKNGQILLEIKNRLNLLIHYTYRRAQSKGPLIMHPINPISIRKYIESKGLKVKVYYIGPFHWFAPFILFDIHVP